MAKQLRLDTESRVNDLRIHFDNVIGGIESMAEEGNPMPAEDVTANALLIVAHAAVLIVEELSFINGRLDG